MSRVTMSTEPEALRLADALDAEFVQGRISNSTGRESAVELRRLALKQWVGLTDQEVMVAAYQAGFDIHEDYENEDDPEAMHWWTPDGEACDDSLLKLRDLIEAKLKEKNI